MDQKLAIGIDIGGTNTKIALVDKKGIVEEHFSFPTEGDKSFEDYLDRLEKALRPLLERAGDKVLGIGVGAPNANPLLGMVESPPNLSWGTIPFGNKVEERFKLPVYLDNDANVAAVGEHQWGMAKRVDNFAVVTLGTGVGTGIYVQGELLMGPWGVAGEGGHLVVDPEGRACNCGGRGHLECYASGPGIELTIQEVFEEKLSVPEVSDLFKSGDERAKKVVDETAHYLGRGLAMMGSVLTPSRFVLAGGVSQLGEDFAELVQGYMNQFIYPPFRNKIAVVISKIAGGHGAVIGASALVFNKEV